MAIVDDDMNEDSVFSSMLDSLNSNLGGGASSSNDLAWADSCLNDDLSTSNTDWSSIKDALSGILSSQEGPVVPIAAKTNTQVTLHEDLNFRDYVASLTYGGISDDDDDDEDVIDDGFGDIDILEISDDDEGNLIKANKRRGARGKKLIENVFRPNYSEDIVKIDDNDPAMALSSTLESSSENIFKVWDLGISEEQDDFTKQLDKALVDFPPPSQSIPGDSTAWNDVTKVSVDDLITGMGDLSLNLNTN